jgi:hypothetical protein
VGENPIPTPTNTCSNPLFLELIIRTNILYIKPLNLANHMYTYKYQDLALTLYEALIPDPFYIELLRSIPGGQQEKQDTLMRYMDYSMTESEKYGQLTIAGDAPYGAAIWSKPLDVATDTEKPVKERFH